MVARLKLKGIDGSSAPEDKDRTNFNDMSGPNTVLPYETGVSGQNSKVENKDIAAEKKYDNIQEARQNIVGDAKINEHNIETDKQDVRNKDLHRQR